MKPVKSGKNMYGERFGKTLPRVELLDVNLTIIEMKKLIFSKVKHMYKEGSPILEEDADAEINRSLIFHVFDNLPMVSEGKYQTRRRA